ncbi:MAG: DUF2272 domain-containing protein [Acetobacteraceae bacterium]|nr:DUF2272 domain-containing protein [Acetobacteraceae bacterium]
MSGCSNLGPVSHIPPFARTPFEAFSRAALVQIALREWRLFGETTDEDDRDEAAKPERAQGLWQRVGEYWWSGLNRDAPEAGWTGKHDEHGKVFPPEKDGEFAWSAAFVSYVMRIAGAGSAFPYSADHAFYINAAKRMTLGTDRGWLMTAERPEAYAPVPGDLICHGRRQAATLRYDDLPTAGLFPAHCDIVVDTSKPGKIGVIGGNIRDSVTLRQIPVTATGKLARPDGVVLDQDQTWFAVLRVRDASSGV